MRLQLAAATAAVLLVSGCAADTADNDAIDSPTATANPEAPPGADAVQFVIERDAGVTVPVSDLDYLRVGSERFCNIYSNETSAEGILDRDFNSLRDFFVGWGDDQGVQRRGDVHDRPRGRRLDV